MTAPLRGNPNDLRHRPPKPGEPTGYFGVCYLADDPKCYSVQLTYAHDTPLLVPGLTRAEITHLVAGGMPTPTILDHARQHRTHRLQHQHSPFYEPGDTMHPLPED